MFESVKINIRKLRLLYQLSEILPLSRFGTVIFYQFECCKIFKIFSSIYAYVNTLKQTNCQWIVFLQLVK